MILSLDEAKKRLAGRLQDIVDNVFQLEGRSGKYYCPFHADNKPSMKYYYNGKYEHMYCFACNKSYGIVDFYKHFKGAKTVQEAYEMALNDIGIKAKVVDNKSTYYQQMNMLYEMAEMICNTIRGSKLSDKAIKFLQKKGIYDPNFLKERGIGQIEPDMLDYLFNKLVEIGGNNIEFFNKSMFAPNMLIFTIFDKEGKPVGFASRNLAFNQNSTMPKYINTKNSLIYKKQFNPYGIDLINGKATLAGYKYVYVVEGYTDAVAMHLCGWKNTIALGGTALNKTTVKILKERGIDLLIFMLDGDDAGRKSVLNFVEKHLPYVDILAAVKKLPEGVDPDEYILQNGSLSINKLKLLSIPEFVLLETKDIARTIDAMNNIPIKEEENVALAVEKLAGQLGLQFNAYKYLYERIKRKYNELREYVRKSAERQIALLED